MEQSPGKLDEDAIRAKAYDLWLERGCPPGSAEEDWLEAERLLGVESHTEAVTPTQPAAETTARSKGSAPPAGKSNRRSSNG
jgi:hypothetical protein